jgi:sulfite exporter TauE/SafE
VEIIIAAILMGSAGSFHCVGMCGPIAIALPLGKSSWWSRSGGALLYNLGRTITYGLLGVVFGIIGEGFSMAGFQRWISITMGALMIASVIFPSLTHGMNSGSGYFSFMSSIKSRLQKLFQKQSKSSLFVIGLLNGLLPCGLVYMAIAGAIATGSVMNSVTFMLVFGLATIPMLFAVSMIGSLASSKLRTIINKLIPVIVVIVGAIFILRGLMLGIPYLSPSEDKLDPQKHQNAEPGNHDHCASVYKISNEDLSKA